MVEEKNDAAKQVRESIEWTMIDDFKLGEFTHQVVAILGASRERGVFDQRKIWYDYLRNKTFVVSHIGSYKHAMMCKGLVALEKLLEDFGIDLVNERITITVEPRWPPK